MAATRELERVTVVGSRPSTLPIEIPTTTESISGKQIEQSINATDAEDALKYFPSLNVRKRYLGDYDHAVLATRASGTGNSARSLVYADGVLLSNLLGNGASYTPRWGLVAPEEIDRVDVMYGPFSAAYPGNSVGAVVDYVTRMPKAFEAHAKLQGFSQDYKQYGTKATYRGHAASASVGSREGAWAWWLNLNRLDSQGQPIAFANRRVSQGVVGVVGTPVSGAVADKNPSNQDWLILGATNQIHTVQDHAKLKLAYDFSPTWRASYTLGCWRNDNTRDAQSYLRDAAGNVVTTGTVNIDGRDYALSASDFARSEGRLEHLAHGLSVKSNTRGTWDWEATASLYDYAKDSVRNSASGDTDMKGTGWNTLALKGIWRPNGEHTAEAGLQRDAYQLRSVLTPLVSAPMAFDGNSTLHSLWAQDAWRFSPPWRAVLGLRLEQWRTRGHNSMAIGNMAARKENHVSPKVAVSYQLNDDWVLKASLGRAVRLPTVAELYLGASGGLVVHNDATLKPEKSWTSEWTAERELGHGMLRSTVFIERTRDALYSQTNAALNLMTIQNVDAVRTHGLELAGQANDVLLKGLTLSSSLTYAHSVITKNDKFPASVGQWQPRVPRWRANLLANYQADDRWGITVGVRYSGRQYGTLDNSDPNGDTYTGVSRFLVGDLRVQHRFDQQWTASFGIDNLGNATYWAFHPYTQRTLHAELKLNH
ncbi:MAG: TonB-dependent receptor [Rhizobacter sp.]|nr:TonB-dependent receptor [Rhizobacter sp.]